MTILDFARICEGQHAKINAIVRKKAVYGKTVKKYPPLHKINAKIGEDMRATSYHQ